MADSGVDTSNESSDNPIFEFNPPAAPINHLGSHAMFMEDNNPHDLVGKIKCSTKARHCRIRYRYGLKYDSSIDQKLRFATTTNNTELADKLLLSGANPNSSDHLKRTCLHLAACRGYTDIVKMLVKYGANPNLTDILGNTPLHLAACTNHVAVVTELLDAGTDINAHDKHGRNPIHLAQSKLKLMLTRTNKYTDPGEETKNLIMELHSVVNLMLKYAKVQKIDSSELESVCQRLEQMSTRSQVDYEIQNLLGNLDSLKLR